MIQTKGVVGVVGNFHRLLLLLPLLLALIVEGVISRQGPGDGVSNKAVELNELVGEVVIELRGEDPDLLLWNTLSFTTPISGEGASSKYRLHLQLIPHPLDGGTTRNWLEDGDSILFNEDNNRTFDDVDRLQSYLNDHQTHGFSGPLNLETKGPWHNSSLTLLLTLLHATPPPSQGGERRTWLACSGESGGESGWSILSSLKCNGRRNCPPGGKDDEEGCGGGRDCEGVTTTPTPSTANKSWYEVQYLLTILLAGLFFILSPICIVIFLFYHRKMSARVQLHHHTHSRAHPHPPQTGTGAGEEVFVTSTPPNDVPPSYEDVHELKTPPPPFHHPSVSPPPTPSSTATPTATPTPPTSTSD